MGYLLLAQQGVEGGEGLLGPSSLIRLPRDDEEEDPEEGDGREE
ncbi:MAG: hypothetical protein NWF12_00605 [Candidatus Bathyarchaeota archaeon]|nr:hypothetical protein [Candidatus Bathyarchaeota archaeon]